MNSIDDPELIVGPVDVGQIVALNIRTLQFYTFQLEKKKKKLRLSSNIQFNIQAQIVSKQTYLHRKIKNKKPWRGKKRCTPSFERSIVPNVLL